MFDQFLLSGSFLSVAFMVYVNSVMFEVARLKKLDPRGIYFTPPIIAHPLSGLFMLAATPCVFWPAIYIGLYDGWISGIVAWFILQIVGALLTFVLCIRHPLLIGIHFVLACIAAPIGYYMSTQGIL